MARSFGGLKVGMLGRSLVALGPVRRGGSINFFGIGRG